MCLHPTLDGVQQCSGPLADPTFLCPGLDRLPRLCLSNVSTPIYAKIAGFMFVKCHSPQLSRPPGEDVGPAEPQDATFRADRYY